MQKSEVFDLRKVINVASVKHRSPFRYPGGKTWFVPYVRKWLDSKLVHTFIEPFAGGAIVSLSVLFDDLVKRIILAEMDEDVSAVWRTILNGNAQRLADKITLFDVTLSAVQSALSAKHRSLLDQAFATILRNRVQRGGILAPGASLMKSGENGKGLVSRWYPQTLANRILDIAQRRDQIEFRCCDGLEVLREYSDDSHAAFFIDPPYTVAGRRLYRHSSVDHELLFTLASKLKGDFLMTYDDSKFIRRLAESYCFSVKEVAMKNTHHTVMSELLISRDFGWLY